MVIPARDRARLVALNDEGAQAYHGGKRLALYVDGIKLRTRDGAYTARGRVWEEIGGSEPVRFHGQMQRSDRQKYINMDGQKHILWSLAPTPQGPVWRATQKGLRFREQNEWEVMIPAIGYAKDKHGNYHSFRDRVMITDDAVTRSLESFGNLLETAPALHAVMAYTRTHAVRDHQAQKDVIRDALQAHWEQEYPNEWEEGRGQIVIARASHVYWTLDVAKAKAGEGFTYDWRSTFVSDGKLRTETILNRALRGVPYVPIDMVRQMNLITEATIDIDLGLCVPIQMQLCLTKRSQPYEDGERQYNRATTSRLSIEEIKDLFEQIHERVHGPRRGKQPTIFQQPTALEQAELGKFYDAWVRKMPLGEVRSLKQLQKEGSRLCTGPFKDLPYFPTVLERVYGLGFDREERYLRYFRAFFDVRGDTVRQRVLPRPQGLLQYIDHTPDKPGGT